MGGGFGVCLGAGLGGPQRAAAAGSGLGADVDAALRSGVGITSEPALGDLGAAACKVGAALGAETALDGSEVPAIGAVLGLTLGPELGTGLAAELGCVSDAETALGAALGVTVGVGPGTALGAVLGTDLGI